MNLLKVLLILGIAGVFTSAHAEDLFEDFEIKLVPKVVTETSTAPTVTFPSAVQSVPAQAQAAPLTANTPNNSGNSQKVLILNQLPVNQKQNAVAGADAVNDNDLDTTVSINSKLRKERFKRERGTESTLLDRLELSRIEDEQERADRLFGDRFSRPNEKVEVSPKAQKVIIIEDAHKEVSAATQLESRYKSTSSAGYNNNATRVYGGVNLGQLSYNHEYVETDTAFGATIGVQTLGNIALEANFLYSESQLQNYTFKGLFSDYDVEQWSIMFAAKYQKAMGKFSPFAGVLLGYTNRDYSDSRNYNNFGGFNNNFDESTASFDYGLTVGADFRVSKSFSVGVDYKYIASFSHDFDDQDDQYKSLRQNNFRRFNNNNKLEPLEDISYSLLSVTAKATF